MLIKISRVLQARHSLGWHVHHVKTRSFSSSQMSSNKNPPRQHDQKQRQDGLETEEITNESFHDRGQRPDPTTVQQLLEKRMRPYFYYIDVHGQVFLQDTRPKNFTSCYKDPKFLDFFFRRIRPNASSYFPEYAWQSPCGKEINFIEAADTPIVFHGLQDDSLVWAGTLRTPFLPDSLYVSSSTGRIYHPLPVPMTAMPSDNQDRGRIFGLLKSSMILSELAAGLDQDSLLWHGERYPLHWID